MIHTACRQPGRLICIQDANPVGRNDLGTTVRSGPGHPRKLRSRDLRALVKAMALPSSPCLRSPSQATSRKSPGANRAFPIKLLILLQPPHRSRPDQNVGLSLMVWVPPVIDPNSTRNSQRTCPQLAKKDVEWSRASCTHPKSCPCPPSRWTHQLPPAPP